MLQLKFLNFKWRYLVTEITLEAAVWCILFLVKIPFHFTLFRRILIFSSGGNIPYTSQDQSTGFNRAPG